MSLQTGIKIAGLKSTVIDPASLAVLAYHLTGRGLQSDNVLLLTNDVREISNIGIIIDSADELVLEDDMIKLKDILALNFQLIGMLVIDEKKNKLGRIYDFALDPMDFKIHQLYVKRPLIRSLQVSNLIINRSQIVEVNNKNIVVSSTSLEERPKPAVLNGDFINPFKKPASSSSSSNATKSN